MGWLDKAKKLAGQAMEKAEEAVAEAKSRAQTVTGSGGSGPSSAPAAGGGDPLFGTPYVPGMLGRAGWRESGLEDPAALLPIRDRDRAGVPHTVHSEIVEEPFGMGRRWTAGQRAAGLFHRIHPDQRAWEPPGGRSPYGAVPGSGATVATLDDGRTLIFLGHDAAPVVLELRGIDEGNSAALARSVVSQLNEG